MDGLGPVAVVLFVAITLLVALPGWLATRSGGIGRIFRDFSDTQPTAIDAEARAAGDNPRFCINCGGERGPQLRFCTHCGVQF
jgi:hypothetical protein